MFPPVVAMRARQTSTDFRTSGFEPERGIAMVKSRPIPSRRSPEAMILQGTQLGVSSQRTPPAANSNDRPFPESTQSTTMSTADFRLPVENWKSPSESEKLTSSFDRSIGRRRKWWQVPAGIERSEVIAMRQSFPFESESDRMTTMMAPTAFAVNGQTRSQPEIVSNTDRGEHHTTNWRYSHSMEEPEAVGKFGLSPRMRLRKPTPPPPPPLTIMPSHGQGRFRRENSMARSTERLPPLNEDQPSHHRIAPLQHHPGLGDSHPATISPTAVTTTVTSPASMQVYLTPLDPHIAPPDLFISGWSPPHFSVSTASSTSSATSTTANVEKSRPEIIIRTADKYCGKQASRVVGGENDFWSRNSSQSGEEVSSTKPGVYGIQRRQSREPESDWHRQADMDDELSLKPEINFDRNEDYDDDENDGEDDSEETQMPVLSVRIEITASDQRRTVVATSDATSTGSDVTEKRKSLSERRNGENNIHWKNGGDCNAGTSVERYVSIAGEERPIVVDHRSYDNFARKRSHQLSQIAAGGGTSTSLAIIAGQQTSNANKRSNNK